MTTSANPSALARLALAKSMALGFVDAFGEYQTTTDAALRKVLACLGVTDTADEAACARSLLAAEEAKLAMALDPVAIWRDGAPQTLRLNSSKALKAALDLIITTETGERVEACLDPAEARRETRGGYTILEWDIALSLPLGYHQLTLNRSGKRFAQCRLIRTPAQCYMPPALREPGQTTWGMAAQLYSLRSDSNWGAGDLADIHPLLDWSAEQGAGFVGLNPLHEGYPHDPANCSPYAPSSRQFFNWLYIHVPGVPEFQVSAAAQAFWHDPATQAQLAAVKDSSLVDYVGLAALKKAALGHCFAEFQALHGTGDTPRAADFAAFRAQHGVTVERLGLYEALSEHFYAQDSNLWGWPVWPEAYRTPDSLEVKTLAKTLADRVDYFIYLQFLLATQLQALKTHAQARKLPVGLYLDLAVGTSAGSADIWTNSGLYSLDCSIGCPPDAFVQLGQNWGLPPMHPERLREQGFEPFIQLLRSLMRYAGAMRIDHAVALYRTFWIPAGCTGKEGAFIIQPFEDLLGLLALESHRNACLVIGEDLGTVPDIVRTTFAAWNVFSYRIFSFERNKDGSYLPPAAYPVAALTAIGTHDTPTLQGFWQYWDISLRRDLNLFSSPEAEAAELADRPRQRQHMLDALIHNGLMPDGYSHNQADYYGPMPDGLAVAMHRFLARTPSKLQSIQFEDLLGVAEQMNMPGTIDEHPNWRRKLPAALPELLQRIAPLIREFR